jgi:spore germination protein YaaH
MPKPRPLLPIIFGLVINLIGLNLVYRIFPPSQVVSPMGQALATPDTTSTQNTPSQKAVFAFLPYWLINTVKDRPLPPITHLAYFGLEFDHTGNLRTHTEDGYAEPGLSHYYKEPFSQLSRKVKEKGGKIVLVLRIMNNTDIEGALSNSTNRQKIITQAVSTVTQRNFDGINIDFEYVGTPPVSTRNNLTKFAQELKNACPKCEISIDVYADAARNTRLWDMQSLGKIVDHVIIMGYDFFTAASDNSGPVAPLNGSCTQNRTDCSYSYDVTSSVRDHTSIIASHKIILGVPFYGYQWATNGSSPSAPTLGRGRTATYEYIQALVTSLKLLDRPYSLKMDSSSNTPYLVYKDGKQTTQIWHDNPESLKLKRELVDEKNLGGVAVWAWGYEDETGSLWDAIKNDDTPGSDQQAQNILIF